LTPPPHRPDAAEPTDESRLEFLRRTLADPLPHPDAAALHAASARLADWLVQHFATLPDQPLGRTASRAQMEALLREPPPEQGSAFEQVLAEFEAKVAPYAIRVNHPRFLAFVPGAPNYMSVLGDWLCAAVNFFTGVWLEAAGPTQVELVVLDWFKEFLNYPAEARGILTSGGSEANLTALVVARERLSFEERSRAVLYETEHRHWSVDRAARVIGLRPDQVRALPAGPDLRLAPSVLGAAVAGDRARELLPWLVVANAGATSTGTVDHLAALAEVCRQQGLWLHVDAAYGWPAVLTAEGRKELDGIALADSITLDPHKWFGQAFEAGCVLIRAGGRLAETFALRPDYMQDVAPADDEINFADHGIALTRRFRALKIWLSVKVLGVGWFRGLVGHCCRLAEYAEVLLRRSARFEVLNPRQLSIVAFRYRPSGRACAAKDEPELDRLNLALLDELRATGQAFLSSTRLQGRVALRFCFVNWRTTARDVEEIVRLLMEFGERMSAV
jgi:glutamate/tyrosine decarboxylase-like PLP-dependent enzyme